MGKNEENWMANYEALKAYIDEHHHLPDKHVVENRGLLSKAKYLRKKIKAGKAEDWMVERFETIRILQVMTSVIQIGQMLNMLCIIG